MIVWCDTETTGLEEKKDLLLEVALVVTDDDLKERAAMSWIINHGKKSAEISMKLVVREMHERSGLLRDIDAGQGSHSAEAAAYLIEAWLQDTFGSLPDLKQIPLAGSTIGFDRKFLRQYMPGIEEFFNHRSIDVSTLTEIANRWNRPVYAHRPKQDKHVPHRALDDARNSAEYLRYYRQHFLRLEEPAL
jgi:oligoribonuclease